MIPPLFVSSWEHESSLLSLSVFLFHVKMHFPNSGFSAETVANNEDLLTEILFRVPAKPLLRFKSVSKHWLTLISNSHFAHRHTRLNSTPKISGIFLRKSPSEFDFLSLESKSNTLSAAPFKSLDFVQDPAGIKILQSCNGLLLCSSFCRIGTTRSYYVYNPTTHKFLKLPPVLGDASTTVFGVNLAFEPSNSPYYKVVCVRSTAESLYCHQIEIFSSKTGAWRLSGPPFVAPFDTVFDDGVFWSGAIHWISPRGNSLCFDVHDERFRKMPSLPIVERCSSARRFRYLGESGGHLHLMEIYGPRATQFKVFEIEKDYSKWVVQYQVDLDAIVAAYPQVSRSYLDSCDSDYYAFVILLLIREDKEEDGESSLILHIPGKLISYNVRNKTFKELCGLSASHAGPKKLQFGWLDAFQYFESLACV